MLVYKYTNQKIVCNGDPDTHKCDDWTEEYLVWKPELVKKPEVIYVSYLFILGSLSEYETY